MVLLALLCGVAASVARIKITTDTPNALSQALEIALRSGAKQIVIVPGTYGVSATLAFRQMPNVLRGHVR